MQRDFLTMYNKIAIDKGKYRQNRKAINRTENTLFSDYTIPQLHHNIYKGIIAAAAIHQTLAQKTKYKDMKIYIYKDN